ncbi:MAG: xanthine dehydrogenase family protein subunit M [Hyphomicrobiales bacterium]|nr:xanthine dehydrogenase family protein subunit M [Hyphomicrobiales bacterium]
MRPFSYVRVDDAIAASQATGSGSAFLAGGTTLLDLMKLDVLRPEVLVDINGLRDASPPATMTQGGMRLSAFASMAQIAADPNIRRDYPMIAQSLNLAASAQLRNMATLGGNVLQRTRCNYFRDPSWKACNKREPGSGCAALDGVNRKHAVLGVSAHCIATYPGDFAQALIALDATVETIGPVGPRVIKFDALHRAPGDTPHVETNLAPSELITAFILPRAPWTRRSLYLKIRDRQSYEFALASAAVALDMEEDSVRQARIALGGIATKPWRAHAAEQALVGKVINEETANGASQLALAHASPRPGNQYKIELGRRTLTRALLQAASMEVRA